MSMHTVSATVPITTTDATAPDAEVTASWCQSCGFGNGQISQTRQTNKRIGSDLRQATAPQSSESVQGLERGR